MPVIHAGLVEISTQEKKGGWYAVLVNGVQHGKAVRQKDLQEAINSAVREFARGGLPQAEMRVSPTLGKLIAISVNHHMRERLGEQALSPGEAQEHIDAILPHVRYGALSAALMLATTKERTPEFWASVEAKIKSQRPENWIAPATRGWSRLAAAISAYAYATARNWVIEGGVNRRWHQGA